MFGDLQSTLLKIKAEANKSVTLKTIRVWINMSVLATD